MLKSEITSRLNSALDLLNEAAEHPKLPKGLRDEYTAFIAQTREELARSTTGKGGEPSRTIWRIAEVENPKTGKTIVLELKKDGALIPSDAKRLGIEHVSEWWEARGTSRVEARQKIAEGDAVRMQRVRGKAKQVSNAKEG